MKWKDLNKAVYDLLVREGLSDDIEVVLDMEPSQPVLNWGISTRFDGEKSLILTSHEYDATKQEWWMTCIRCNRSSMVYGTRNVCYQCDPILYPRPEDE